MPVIQWTDAFSVGEETIDEQHRTWIDIYNKAHDRMMTPGEDFASTGLDALVAMEEYGRFHFDYEEAWLEKIGFPHREDHAQLHQDFVRKMAQIRSDMVEGRYILNSEIIKTIENWLKEHILNEDQKFKAFVAVTTD